MTTPTPRWTAETEELVARALYGRRTERSIDAGRVDVVDWDWDNAPLAAESRRLWRTRAAGILTALADAGVLTPVGGETRTIWRTRNVTSGGSSVHWTRESADNAMAFRSRPGVPWDPPPDPYVLETAEQTTCPDGTVITSPWREVTDDPA